MSFQDRLAIIKEIEQLRSSRVICYLTSLRPGVPAQMADDSVRVIFDHLLALPNRPVDRLDIFLVSNGGSGTVPWRLVAVIREFAKSFSVLIPYRAYSAATLLALGANEIVMHPFGELGPIDPTVANEFNPSEQGRRLGISVEDVRAYVSFVKTTVGIAHEDELIKAIEILADKVHPLALGNVERFVSQSRLIARKILKTHMSAESDEHAISEIIESLASKLFFHGHPINRREALSDLRMKVASEVNARLENLMWDLYLDFETEFKNTEIFNPAMGLANVQTPQAAPVAIPIQIQGQPQTQFVQANTLATTYETEILHGIVESTAMSHSNKTARRYTLQGNQTGQPMVREDILRQDWEKQGAPQSPS
jgi:hypothetical protein